MKLWQKISLICGCVLIFTVAACCALLLADSGRSILELTYARARGEQGRLAASFSEMAEYYAGAEDGDSARFSLVSYCFTRFADAGSVLVSGGETVYPNAGVRPQDYLPLADAAGNQLLYTGKIGASDMLIVGSRMEIMGVPYDVYVVMDISPVYAGMRIMAWRFAAVGAAAVAFGFCLIVLLVRRSTRPLAELGASAKRIAAGHYEERAAVYSTDESGALASDFNVMAAAIERRIEELTQTALRQRLFIGGVTHEFKTPLTAILLNADTLQNAYMDEDDRQRSLVHIERQSKWLERLTQKLLTLIVLKERITPKITPVAPLLERVRDTVSGTLAERGTPLETVCEADTLLMDADLMQSALVNLVDNASKASEPGQPVVLWAAGGAIEVRDRGRGIPTEELAHITEPFYTVDKSRGKKSGGSGLGLALVKEIAEAHAAVLTVRAGHDGGTVARVEFDTSGDGGKPHNN